MLSQAFFLSTWGKTQFEKNSDIFQNSDQIFFKTQFFGNFNNAKRDEPQFYLVNLRSNE